MACVRCELEEDRSNWACDMTTSVRLAGEGIVNTEHRAAAKVTAASAMQLRVPPGPAEPFSPSDDLFLWMGRNFSLYGDIYKASIFGSDVYVVSNPEYCERILRWNWRNYPRKGQIVKRIALLLGNGLIASNGEFWASQRRMVQPAFTRSSIESLIGTIVRINVELLKNWKRAAGRCETVNVTRDVSSMVLKGTLTAIFGKDYERVAQHFRILAEESDRNLEFALAFRPLGYVIRQVLAERRQGGRVATDFLGTMMLARDRERGASMPDAQLVKEVLTLIVAGHETTASLLNWIWYLLARYPEAQAKLCDELDRLPWAEIPAMDTLSKYTYTRQVIDEALRLYPPLWLMTRKALADDWLGEFFVPARTEIYISPYLIQRSPRFWEVPDQFDPDRLSRDEGTNQHELALCPFGAGPRNCIGEQFARVETQIHLMMCAKELRLTYNDEKPAEVSPGMNLLSKHEFIMYPELRIHPDGAHRGARASLGRPNLS